MSRSPSPAPDPRAQGPADITEHPELEWAETVAGARPVNRYVRIRHTGLRRAFRRDQGGRLIPREDLGEPRSPTGRIFARLKHPLIGEPIATAREAHERLNKVQALAADLAKTSFTHICRTSGKRPRLRLGERLARLR